AFLLHSGVAHGRERQRRRDHRSVATAAGSQAESATRLFRTRQGFPGTRNQEQSNQPKTLRIDGDALPRQIQRSRARVGILPESGGLSWGSELRQEIFRLRAVLLRRLGTTGLHPVAPALRRRRARTSADVDQATEVPRGETERSQGPADSRTVESLKA